MEQNYKQQRSSNGPISSGRKFAIPAAARRAFRPAQAGAKQTEQNNSSVKINRNYRPQNAFRPNAQTAPKLKIIPLGGQEEVGRNMTIFEYGDDIVILDMGMQFPEENMPGIDYIIPNISYLKGKEKKIRGIIFSHGHLDHIGAAPILLKKLGYPLIIGRDMTLALIKKRMEDHEKGSVENLKILHIKSIEDRLTLGNFKVGFFAIEHSVIDAVGVTLNCSEGTVIHPGDWTIDQDAPYDKAINYSHLAQLPRPTILMLESLGATNYKKHISEKTMNDNLERLIRESPGRTIIGTFSSQIARIEHIINYASKIKKYVILDGYSLKTNIEITRELGYIKFPQHTIIPIKSIDKYPNDKIIVICTGSQGEDRAVFSRIVNNTHKYINIQKNDTVIFSSSVIPGNERTIQSLKDSLYRRCDNVIHGDLMDVHVSGHCTANDIKDMIRQVKPTYFLPVYANHFFLKESAKLASSIGFPKENIFILDNGSIFELTKNNAKIQKEKIDTSYVFVDGLGVGDIGHIVLRDRKMMSQDGMFTIIVIIDSKTGNTIQEPDIISRGFIYMKESRELLRETRFRVKKIITEKTKEKPINWTYVRNNIRDLIGEFLYQKTQRRPMVLPVIIKV